MYSILQNKTRGLEKELTALTQELIRTPSPSLKEGDVADLVERAFRELGYEKVYRDEAGNVIGYFLGHEGEPTVLLNSHIDTVLPEPEGWEVSPHAAPIVGGKIVGLGAADCKGGLAAQIIAGAALRRSLLPLRGNLVVAATVAEENGRSLGVRTLIERTLPQFGLKPDFAVLGEPTNLNLYYGHDGWMEMDVIVEGTNPFQVDDAARAIYAEFESASPTEVEEQAPVSLLVNSPRFAEEHSPRRAMVGVARRLRASETATEVIHQMKREASQVARQAGAVAVEVAVREEHQQLYTGRTTLVRHVTHAWSTDPFHPLLERARHALSAAGIEAHPGKWQLDRLGMGTAGSVLSTEFGIPTIGFGPGDESAAHAANEYVSIASLGRAAYGTAAIAQALVGIPVFGWADADDEI